MSTAPDAAALPILDSTGNGLCLREPGFTAREHAAIALRVPDSGNEWLDAMIRTAQRNDLAKAAMQGWLASYGPDEKHPVAMDCEEAFARLTHALADAMLSGAATQRAEGE